MMHPYTMTPPDKLRLDRGAAHLHGFGPRAVSEALTALAARVGGVPALLTLLAEYERLTPGMVRAAAIRAAYGYLANAGDPTLTGATLILPDGSVTHVPAEDAKALHAAGKSDPETGEVPS